MTRNHKLKIRNERGKFGTLCLEPWGEDYGMLPEDVFDIVAVNPEETFCFHVDWSDEDILVWAEGDAEYVAVYQNDEMLRCGHNRREQ